MTAISMLAKRIGWEQKSFWRNPAAAVFTFAFPLIFLVVFVAINGNDTVDVPGGTVKFAQYYVPAIVGFGLISACYTSLAFTLCLRRENGLLKRQRGTPLSPLLYLSGIVGNVIVVSLILCTLVLALGLGLYGVTWPGHYVGFIVTIVVAAFCFSALGALVSTIVPNEDAAPAVINFILFPLLFISGTFSRLSTSSALTKVANVFPVRHLNEALVGVFSPFSKGTGMNGTHLAVMAAWGAGALLICTKRFRWEPRR